MTARPTNTRAVPAVFAVVTAWDGLGYLLGPPAWSSSPSLRAFTEWPGGIHTYAVLLLLASTTLLTGLTLRSVQLLRVGLAIAAGAYAALCVSVLGSWALAGIVAWGGPTKGFGLAALAVLIMRRVPPPARTR